MPGPFTTYSDILPRTNVYAEARFLSHAIPNLVLERYAKSMALPKNRTATIKFRRAIPFDVSTTPLQEGVTPPAQGIQFEDVFTSIKQFGAWAAITDVIQQIHEDPVLDEVVDLSSEQAAQTRELYSWGQFQAGTSVFYSSTTPNPTLRTQVNAPINLQIQRRIETFLERQYAKKITRMLKPSPDYGTEPVPEAYVGICHTDVKPDLYDMANFVRGEKYASGSPEPYEVGKSEGVRYVASAFLQPFASAGSATLNGMRSTNAVNVDVYSILYFGQEALGVVPLKGMNDVQIGIRNPGQMGKDSGDPLGQRGYVAWKMWHAALILNQNWLVRAEVGATA